MLYVIFKGIAEDKNIINVYPDIISKFFGKEIFHDSDKGGWCIHLSLHHDFIREWAKWGLYGVVFDIIRVYSGLKIGIAEIYLASGFSSCYCTADTLLIGDLQVVCFCVLISGSKIYHWSDSTSRFGLNEHASTPWCSFSF